MVGIGWCLESVNESSVLLLEDIRLGLISIVHISCPTLLYQYFSQGFGLNFSAGFILIILIGFRNKNVELISYRELENFEIGRRHYNNSLRVFDVVTA